MWSETSSMLKKITKEKYLHKLGTSWHHSCKFTVCLQQPELWLKQRVKHLTMNSLHIPQLTGQGPAPGPHRPPLRHIPSSSPLTPAGILPPVLSLRGVPAPPAAPSGRQ